MVCQSHIINILKFLQNMINFILQTGKMPRSWKGTNKALIPKENQNFKKIKVGGNKIKRLYIVIINMEEINCRTLNISQLGFFIKVIWLSFLPSEGIWIYIYIYTWIYCIYIHMHDIKALYNFNRKWLSTSWFYLKKLLLLWWRQHYLKFFFFVQCCTSK